MDQSKSQTVIGEDVEVVGSIKCASHIQIDGKLNGDLSCGGDAVIGQTAAIKGNLSVTSTTIHGNVNGNVTAKDKIELKSTAHVTGDIRAKRLTVEDGVSFVGKAEVNPTGTSTRSSSSRSDTSEPEAQEETPPADTSQETSKKSGIFGRK